MRDSSRKKLHICVFNHDAIGISDQIATLIEAFESKISITISDELLAGVDNLLIENFTHYQVEQIRKNRLKDGCRIFVLLTEHFALDETGTLFLNDQHWSEPREYIPDLYQRFLSLIELSDSIDAFLVLYNMPNINLLNQIFPNVPIFNIAEFKEYKICNEGEKLFDFCFVGGQTRYRQLMVERLRSRFSVYSGTGLSPRERDKIIRQSRFSLNIPQDDGWTNISPMRIMSSARQGVLTVNISSVSLQKFPYLITISSEAIMALDLENINSMGSFSTGHRDIFNCDSDLDKFVRWIS